MRASAKQRNGPRPTRPAPRTRAHADARSDKHPRGRLPSACPAPPSFIQGFPNLRLFSRRIHKQSLGGFVGFQCLAIDPNPIVPLPNFLPTGRDRPTAENRTSNAAEVFGVTIDS